MSQNGNKMLLGKRKKVREKRADYLHNWIDKTTQHTLNFPPPDAGEPFDQINYGGFNLQQQQRLFNAVSDPSVCRFSNPFVNPSTVEPSSLPPYVPLPFLMHHNNNNGFYDYNTLMLNHMKQINRNNAFGYYRRKNRTSPKHTSYSNGNKVHVDPVDVQMPPNENRLNDFTSLPPVVDEIKDNTQSTNSVEDNDKSRRFSDPGLAQNQLSGQDDSETETDSSYVPYADRNSNRLIMCLIDHINLLKECNGKLNKELSDAKGELESLRRQLSIWRGDSASSVGHSGNAFGGQSTGPLGSGAMYAPGMLADLVREIRDAAKMREEALYSKVRTIIEEKTNKNHTLSVPSMDKSRTSDRLTKLEDEIHNLRLNQSRESLSPCSFAGGDLERVRMLQLELKKERAARLNSDDRVNKLEMLVTQMGSKKTSGGGGCFTPVSTTPVHSMNGGGSRTPDPRSHGGMVMGPITDL